MKRYQNIVMIIVLILIGQALSITSVFAQARIVIIAEERSCPDWDSETQQLQCTLSATIKNTGNQDAQDILIGVECVKYTSDGQKTSDECSGLGRPCKIKYLAPGATVTYHIVGTELYI